DNRLVSAALLVRSEISTNASGKALMPTPSTTAHTHGMLPGASSRPSTATMAVSANPTAQPDWLRVLVTSCGSTMLIGMPTSKVTPSSAPAVVASMPADLNTSGSQPMTT